MIKRNGKERSAAHAMPSDGNADFQIADIIARMNAIAEDPLKRLEAEQLRRAYASAVVRYFDSRRIAEKVNRQKARGYRSKAD